MNVNTFHAQQPQPQYPQPSNSQYLFTLCSFDSAAQGSSNMVSGFYMPQDPQQRQQLQQRQQQQQQQEHAMATSPSIFYTSSNGRNETGSKSAPSSTAFSALTHPDRRNTEANTSLMSPFQNPNNNSVMNYSNTNLNFLSSQNSIQPANFEASSSTFLYSIPVQQEAAGGGDAAPRFMFLTSPRKNGPDSLNGTCYYMVDAPGASAPVNCASAALSSAQPSTVLLSSTSPTAAAANAMGTTTTRMPPYQVPTAHQPQPGANVLGISWAPQFSSGTGPSTAPSGVLPFLFSSPQIAQVDNAIFTQRNQQQSYCTSAAFGVPASSSVPSPLGSCRRGSNSGTHSDLAVQRGKSSRNSGNNSGSGSGSGVQEGERRGGLPFDKDPVPIDITKTQLIVNYLPQSLTDDVFRGLFSRYGLLHRKQTKIINDQVSGRRKGYGFVYYKDGRSTEAAIKAMNGFEVGGRALKVRYADQQRSTVDCDSCQGDDEVTVDLCENAEMHASSCGNEDDSH